MKKRNFKKIVIGVLLFLGITIILLTIGGWCYLYLCTTDNKAPGNDLAGHKGLYVDGTVLKDSAGNEIVLRGINHAHCWYRDYDETAFDAIQATGANCVRIVLADGERWDKDTAENLNFVLNAAKERKMIAVIEVHDGTGSDDIEVLRRITDYWVEMADTIKGTEAYCILNIANEWCGSWDAGLWKQGYEEAIIKLRNAGIENVLMIDAAGWGQFGRSIRTDGYDVFMSDPLANTMFSVHMYGMSGRYEWLIRYNLEGATNQNLCVCVGEFGYKHSDGNVKEDYLMKYCTDNKIGYMAWSWKGNSGGVEYLDISQDWEGNSLNGEWGENLIYGDYGIKNTSVTANVFD